MKKIVLDIICLILLLSLIACGKKTDNNISKPSDTSNNNTLEINNELSGNNLKEITAKKDILKLQFLPALELFQTEPAEKSVDIAFENLAEIEPQRYDGNANLQVFVDYINDEFGVVIDDNWQMLVHYFDADKTAGSIEFDYLIEDIGTNKRIIFSFQDGRTDTLYYRCLDANTDEDKLKNRVRLFKEKYEQEKYQLKMGEKFVREEQYYTYNYDTGDLAYFYYVFFSDDEGIINNDYATICLIDENGNAILK